MEAKKTSTKEELAVRRQQRDEEAGITPARRAELDDAMKAHVKAVMTNRNAIITSRIRRG